MGWFGARLLVYYLALPTPARAAPDPTPCGLCGLLCCSPFLLILLIYPSPWAMAHECQVDNTFWQVARKSVRDHASFHVPEFVDADRFEKKKLLKLNDIMSF
jgi:hypothetical protein